MTPIQKAFANGIPEIQSMPQEPMPQAAKKAPRRLDSFIVSHAALEPGAIRAAESVIHSWVIYGIHDGNEIAPALMPTAQLERIAHIVIGEAAQGACGEWANFVPAMGNDHDREAFMSCVESPRAPEPPHCQRLLETLRSFYRVRETWRIGIGLQKADGDEERKELTKRLLALDEVTSGTQSLRHRAYALRYDPDSQPPPDEVCLVIADIPIAARGNLTALQGKSKVGKSAVVAAILGAAQRADYATKGDTLSIGWQGAGHGAIIHLDTEQSPADWHALVSRSVTRSGLPAVAERLVSIPIVRFARSERMQLLSGILKHEKEKHGAVDLVVIDGIADLCTSPNDEAESLELISNLMALAHEYSTAVVCILHENPASDQGKTRGHLGSELNRKAFANLRIDKDTETAISTLYGTDMRKREIPKEHGFCFAWDTAAGMHTFQGRAAGLLAAARDVKAAAKATEEWEMIFEEIGTKRECPDLSPNEAAEAHRDIHGTKNLMTLGTMKKRMQRAESLGVLRKTQAGRWALNVSGQTGHERDK
jgi:AAA domain